MDINSIIDEIIKLVIEDRQDEALTLLYFIRENLDIELVDAPLMSDERTVFDLSDFPEFCDDSYNPKIFSFKKSFEVSETDDASITQEDIDAIVDQIRAELEKVHFDSSNKKEMYVSGDDIINTVSDLFKKSGMRE